MDLFDKGKSQKESAKRKTAKHLAGEPQLFDNYLINDAVGSQLKAALKADKSLSFRDKIALKIITKKGERSVQKLASKAGSDVNESELQLADDFNEDLFGDEPGEKSQETAMILCAALFVVLIGGLHRFYLGYTVIGIVQLLTFGGCGIWAIIDFIMLLTGNLKPRVKKSDLKP